MKQLFSTFFSFTQLHIFKTLKNLLLFYFHNNKKPEFKVQFLQQSWKGFVPVLLLHYVSSFHLFIFLLLWAWTPLHMVEIVLHDVLLAGPISSGYIDGVTTLSFRGKRATVCFQYMVCWFHWQFLKNQSCT